MVLFVQMERSMKMEEVSAAVCSEIGKCLVAMTRLHGVLSSRMLHVDTCYLSTYLMANHRSGKRGCLNCRGFVNSGATLRVSSRE